MHKFYWNNKQPQGSGYNATVDKTPTTDTVYDKTRQNAQQQRFEVATTRAAGRRGKDRDARRTQVPVKGYTGGAASAMGGRLFDRAGGDDLRAL